MKITTITAAVTEPVEAHRGDGADSGDPAIAFLAALGQLLPGLINPIAPISDGKSDTATVVLNGLSLDAKAPTIDPNAVLGSSSSGKTAPGDLASVALSAVSVGSATELGKSLLADFVAVPSHPLIASDRAGVPAVSALPDAVPAPGVPVQVAPSAVLPVIAQPSVAESVKSLLADLVAVPAHPLIASDRIGVPTVSVPAVSVPTVNAVSDAVPALGVPAQVPSGVVLPVVGQGSVAESVNLPAADREQVPVRLAPALESNPQAPTEVPEIAASVIAAAPKSTPRFSGSTTAASKVASESAPVTDDGAENTNVKTSSAIPSTQTSTSVVTAPDSAEPDGIVETNLLAGPTGRGSGHAKPLSTQPSRNDEQEVKPTSANPVSLATPARTESTSPIAVTGSPRPPVAAQIAPYVAALRHESDGTHQITVVLHPADLGQVQIVVELRDGTVNLQLSGAHDAAREALSTALPQLRRELTDAGLSVGRTDVLSQDSGFASGAFTGGAFTGGSPRQGFQAGPMPSNAEDSGLLLGNLAESAVPVAWRSTHAGAVDVSI